MITNRTDVNNLLSQMREMKALASGSSSEAAKARSGVEGAVQIGGSDRVEGAGTPDFGEMFSNAINKVNETQQTAGHLATAYERGDPGVTLTQVMVAAQKASISFQAVTEVRNKLVQAYKDIMSMPI